MQRSTSRGQESVLQYEYDKLDDGRRGIRLLTLMPSTAFSDDVKCLVHQVSLESTPSYETISYAWGDPNDTRPILVNGFIFSATKNLESALRHLRKSDESLVLWADALCINQRNNKEKAHQVAMMGEIYKACSRVYIWLGEDAQSDPFSFARHFAANKHIHELPYFQSTTTPGVFSFSETDTFKNHWSGLMSCAKSAWWSRLWCVQEVLLPPKGLVVLGQWRVPWATLQVSQTNRRKHYMTCCANILFPSRYIHNVDALVLQKKPATQGCSLESLDWVLRAYAHKRCEDPRDKIYGVLGLVNQKENLLITPDYSLTTAEVYTRTMEAILLNRESGLQCLTGFGFHHYSGVFPSWVRDFAVCPDKPTAFQELARMDKYHLYNASGIDSANARIEARRSLHLQGAFVAKIDRVGATLQDRNLIHIRTVLQNWHSVAGIGLVKDLAKPLEELNDKAFWVTLIGDAVLDAYSRWRRLKGCDMDPYSKWVSAVLGGWSCGLEAPLESDYVFLLAMLSASYGRAMFVTERGEFGLSAPAVRPNDEIWVLHGGRVPFVLRPPMGAIVHEPLEFELVNDCYLAGYMDEEAAQLANYELQEVVLK